MANINIDLDTDQFEDLKATKQHYGLTWKGMLIQAQRSLEAEAEESAA